MSISLILSDIHNRIEIAQKIMDSVPHDLCVQMGDLWDSYGDNYFDAIKTSVWVKNQLDNNPKYIQLTGNHCSAYRWPSSTCRNCSGFTLDKCHAINSILSKKDWDKFLPYFYHAEGNWMISHAGFDKSIFQDDLRNDLSKLKDAFDSAILDIEGEKRYHPYFGVGYARGGSQEHGGITWEDFNSINPIPEYNQIVGHTILKEPTIKFRTEKKYLKTIPFNSGLVSPHNANRLDLGDIVIGIDTNNRHYALITDGILTIHEIPIEWSKSYEDDMAKQKSKQLFELFQSTKLFM